MRLAPVLGVIVALALGATATVAFGGGAPAHAAAGSSLQVNLVEYRVMLSEAVVKAGPVDLEAIDSGMDPHDLDLRRGRSGAVISEPALGSGQRWDGVVDLHPGVYHLWCSLPQHWRLGMHATLRVVR